MAVLIARRRLRPGEFTSWETRFIERASEREAAGCVGATYFRNIDDPDEVVMLLRWRSVEEGRAFLNNMIAQFPRLSSESGASAELDFVFTEEVGSLPN